VRLLTPFDPVVWDRDRFEMLWGWVYRFEAYTPAPKRKLGYYAMPLLWRDRVIGWGNLSVKNGDLQSDLGYVSSPPRDRAFKRELEAELDRMRAFLGIQRQEAAVDHRVGRVISPATRSSSRRTSSATDTTGAPVNDGRSVPGA
jgi:uncharacterized protein YcaQ